MSLTNVKYMLKYKVTGTDDAKRKSMKGGGPLKVDPEHWLYKSLPAPHIFDDDGGGPYINLHLIEYLTLDAFEWSDDLIARNLAWYISPDKVYRFLAKADSLGLLPWGDELQPEQLSAVIKEMAAKMPSADIQLDASDTVSYAETSDGDHCFYRIKAAQLVANDESMLVAVDFKTAMAGGYVESERDDDDTHFQEMLEILLGEVADGLDQKGLAYQAAKIVSWYRKTQPEQAELRRYLEWDHQQAEIIRRGQVDESARFIPLLDAAWNRQEDAGFPQLKRIIKDACTGAEASRLIAVLATHAKMDPRITGATCTALCNMTRGHVLTVLDSPENSKKPDTERVRIVGEMLATALDKGTAETLSAKDPAAIEKMHASAAFTELVKQLEALNTDPVDYNEVVKTLAKSAVGRIYLVGGKAATPVMNHFKAARLDSEMTAALNAILAVEKGTKTKLDAVVINGTVAPALIHGKFGFPSFDPWRDLCKGVILKRDGNKAAMSMGQGTDGSFWADEKRLKKSETTMVSSMAFIGHSGNASGSFESFYDGMIERAEKIDNLPDTELRKAGLQKMLIQVGTGTMSKAAERDQTMLKESEHKAIIPLTFLVKDSAPYRLLSTLDENLQDAMKRARMRDDFGLQDEDSKAGMATHAHQQWQGGYQQGGYQQDTYEQQWQPLKRARQQGEMLQRWGSYLVDEGIVFGGKFLVMLGANADPSKIARNTCLGKINYLRDPHKRGEWCNLGCTHAEHARPDGMTEADFEVINLHSTALSNEQAAIAKRVLDAKIAWVHIAGKDSRDDIMGGVGGGNPRSAAEAASSSTAIVLTGGRGDFPRRKGGGRGAPPGKGRGAPPGKGKGASKGKGGKGQKGGGRGRQQSFGWQRN